MTLFLLPLHLNGQRQLPRGVLQKRWSAILLKKSLWHGCFAVNFVKFLKVPFPTEHLR